MSAEPAARPGDGQAPDGRTPTAGTRWVRAPRQERARRTFERVLDTGAQLLAEQGYEGFSISEVCRRAQVSPGALYDRIDSKDSLFLAIHEREVWRLHTEASDMFADGPRWQTLPIGALVVEAVRKLGEHCGRNEAILRVFILRSAVDERVQVEGEAAAAKLLDVLVALLLTRSDEIARFHVDPATAVRTVCQIVWDSLCWRTAFGIGFGGAETSSAKDWSERLSGVCCTYLLTPTPPLSGLITQA